MCSAVLIVLSLAALALAAALARPLFRWLRRQKFLRARWLTNLLLILLTVAVIDLALTNFRAPGVAPASGITAQQLKDLLSSFLQPIEVQQKQQQDIVEAIRQGPSSGGGGDHKPDIYEPTGWGLGGYLVSFALIFLGGTITALGFLSRSRSTLLRGALGLGGLSLGLGGLSLGGFTLFKEIDHLVSVTVSTSQPVNIELIYRPVEGPKGDAGPQGPPGEKGDKGEPGKNGANGKDALGGNVGLQLDALDCGDENHSRKIGPFVTASATKFEDEVSATAAFERISGEISSGDRALLGVVLVGSADKRPLIGAALQTFGSNAGLAEQRAMTVKKRLSAGALLDRVTTVAIYAGPLNVGISLPSEKLAFDRSVQVCALWGASIEPKATDGAVK